MIRSKAKIKFDHKKGCWGGNKGNFSLDEVVGRGSELVFVKT